MIARMFVLLAIVGALALGFAARAHAQVGVSPQLLDVDLDKPNQSYAFRFYNFTDEAKHIVVSVVNFDMDDANKVRLLAPSEQSLDRWMILNPTEFDVAAGQSQVARFAIRPEVALLPGEHRALVYFDERPKALEGDKPLPTLRARFRIGAAVYGHVGDVVRKGDLGAAKADAKGFEVEVTSSGNATSRFEGTYTVWKKSSFPGMAGVPELAGFDEPDFKKPPNVERAGPIPRVAILPGTKRRVVATFDPPLESGDYTVALKGHFGSTPVELALPARAAGK